MQRLQRRRGKEADTVLCEREPHQLKMWQILQCKGVFTVPDGTVYILEEAAWTGHEP